MSIRWGSLNDDTCFAKSLINQLHHLMRVNLSSSQWKWKLNLMVVGIGVLPINASTKGKICLGICSLVSHHRRKTLKGNSFWPYFLLHRFDWCQQSLRYHFCLVELGLPFLISSYACHFPKFISVLNYSRCYAEYPRKSLSMVQNSRYCMSTSWLFRCRTWIHHMRRADVVAHQDYKRWWMKWRGKLRSHSI